MKRLWATVPAKRPFQVTQTFRNERLTYRLNIVAQEAISANDRIFLRETGCSIRELRVLRLIDDTPGTTFAQIAKAAGLERSLTSRVIQNLLKVDLIERRNSKDDARVFFLHTTQKGRETRRVARQLSDRLEIILTEPLSTHELKVFNEMVETVGRWISSDEYRGILDDI